MLHSTLRLGSGYPDLSPYLRPEVQVLQRALVRWGYAVSTDGEFGPMTDTAVRSFQQRQGLRDDGIVGPRTWSMLLSERAAPTGSGYTYKPPSAPEPSPAAAPSVLSTSTTPAWMELAKNEVGQQEVAGQAANPRIIEYHAATTLKSQSDEVAWCSSFVNWCLTKAGIAGTRSAAAASWVGWGGRSETRYGAITVIYNAASANSSLSRSGNHVGFLVEDTSTHYVLLGGNQSNSVKVTRFPKKKWKLKACRWPAEAQ
jgi:uncharacterized protein (TIGR02594 family)